MAKKATAEAVEVAPQEKVVTKVAAPVQPTKPTWEIKDRLYILKDNKRPIVFTLPAKHSNVKPLLWFDEKTGLQKEIRYATNQNSPFVPEQTGTAVLGRIIFRNGELAVPKEQQNLQKLLSLYHPAKDTWYYEFNPIQDSVDELEYINMEIDALTLARELGIEEAEAILRVEYGNKVDTLSSSELKRDLIIFAKRNPHLFIQLAHDENVELRNIGVKATQAGLIQLSSDQRTFTYGDAKRKLMTVPFDEHPYNALAAYFKTDDGMEIYKHIIKRL
tara:strand:- start:1331 stop:2155 length:825 start_codon:yes stop_codon:yes gene_type:complete